MFTFGKKVIIFTNCDEIGELYMASLPYEEIVRRIGDYSDIANIKLDFLTKEHEKEFLEVDVFALLEECFLQKKAIHKIMNKHNAFDEYLEYYLAKEENIELFETELFMYLSARM